MKIINAPDLHIPDRRIEPEWHQKAIASLTALAETVERERPMLVAIPGDLWHGGIQNSEAAGFPAVLHLIIRILDICPIAAVSGTGSHDPIGAYKALSRLKAKHPLILLDPAEVSPPVAWLREDGEVEVEISSKENPVSDGHTAKLMILGLPEPTREWLLAKMEGKESAEVAQAMKTALRSILLGLGALRAQYPEIPCIFLFHGLVRGAAMQNGQVVGSGELGIGREDLQLIASDITARYGGNGYPKEWGELGQAGFDMVDLQPGDTYGSLGHIHLAQEVVKGKEIAVTRFDYPHPPRAKFVLDWPEPLTGDDVGGKQCWIVYRVRKEDVEKCNAAALLDAYLDQGALPGSRVTVDVLPTETVRAAEITECRALSAKLLVYDQASGGFSLAKTILDKADQLEHEAAEHGATAGMHFRLHRMRLRGAVGIWKGQRQDEIDIDLDKYSPGLLALVGVNGAGKSTLIENMHPYPCMLTRDGKLQDHFRLRDSVRELWFTDERNGTEYRALMEIDGANTSGAVKYHLFKNGEPVTNGRKEDYEETIGRMVGSLSLFLRSAFVSQRPTKSNPDLSDATKGEKKAIFRELAGLDYLQAYSESAKVRAAELEDRAKADRVRANLIESMVSAEPDVQAAIDKAHFDVTTADGMIAGLTTQGTALREKVETLAALVVEQDEIGRDIGTAANEAQKKLAQVEQAKEKIESYQEALGKRDQAQVDIDRHATLKEQEGAENERLAGINKKRSSLSAQWADAITAYRANENRLQAAKTRIATAQVSLYGDRKVLQTKIDHAAAEVAGNLTENCPTCGQKLPEEKLEELKKARTAKLVIIDDWKHHGAKLDRELSDLAEKLKAAEKEIVALEEPERPKLPSNEGIVLDRIRGSLRLIDIDTARETLAIATKAETEIATLQSQITTLEAEATELVKKAQQLKANLDPRIRTAHDAAKADYEKARADYTQAKEGRATAAAKLEAAQKRLEEICKQKQELQTLKESLDDLGSEAAEWRYLESACGPDGIQALELDALGPGIAEVANRLLAAAYGSRFSIEFRTTRIAGKGSKTKQVEDFAIIVLDNELLTEQPIETLSGGESVWIKRALYDAFAIIREKTTGLRFLTAFQDEADGALDPDSRNAYFAMLRAAHVESGRRHTIVITHSPEAQEAIEQKIEMKRP